MTGYRGYHLFVIVLCVLAPQLLGARTAWRPIELRTSGQPITTLSAIEVPATAHYKARDFSAHVIFLGYQKDGGLGYPQLSVIIDGLENAVSASELSLFQGPDLSKIVLERNTMEVSIVRNRATWSIKTRSVFTGIPFFPSQITGHETQMFETNIGSTKSEVYAWRKFVAEMSSGFDEAHITIGGQVLSEKITVAFSGKGIEPLLKQMMTFTGLK